jgi:hypothetical protein
MLTKRTITDKLAPIICMVAPAICYLIQYNSASWFGNYQIGIEMLILNGSLTFMGLFAVSKKAAF